MIKISPPPTKTNIQHHKPQPLLHAIKWITYVRPHLILSHYFDRWHKTHLLNNITILHILPSFHWLNIPSLYLYHVQPWVRKYHPSLPTPVHILTYSTYLCVLLHGNLTQNMLQPNCDLSTKLTHIPQNRTFILNGLLYIYKTSPHNTKKTSFTKILSRWSFWGV